MTTCIACSCTDEEACEGGCSWLAVSPGEHAGLCSACGLGAIGAVTLEEAAEACEEAEQDWTADQVAIQGDHRDAERSLLLPGDPGYMETLRGR